MCGIVKNVVRFGLITALVGGSAAVVAETARPGSVRAILHQVGGGVATVIDSNIDDPVALRAQLRSLEAEYPAKISEVRSDLNEVEDQIAQLDRDLAVSQRVVALAQDDLSVLDDGIAQARAVSQANQGAIVRISFENRSLGVNDAYGRRAQIEQTAQVYATRTEEISTELTYLTDQRDQLADLLTNLETERAQFQAQLFQLDAQIDSIARNDRMIAMMEDRQKTIDEHTRYKAHSLDQIQQRLAKVRGEQADRLASITNREQTRSYEDMARWELREEGKLERLTVEPAQPKALPFTPTVIEIDPLEQADPVESAESLASNQE